TLVFARGDAAAPPALGAGGVQVHPVGHAVVAARAAVPLVLLGSRLAAVDRVEITIGPVVVALEDTDLVDARLVAGLLTCSAVAQHITRGATLVELRPFDALGDGIDTVDEPGGIAHTVATGTGRVLGA